MQDLKTIYKKIADNYDDLWKNISNRRGNSEFSTIYACQDVYALEPFYQQKNNISDKKMQTYSDKNTLPGGLGIYEYLLKNGNVVYSRHIDHVDMVNDRFFIYKTNEIWIYEFHILFEEKRISSVQYLKLDKKNNPLRFEYYNKFGSYKMLYEHYDFETVITTSSTRTKNVSKTQVLFDANRENVTKIVLLGDDINSTLFELNLNSADEHTLLEKVKKIIIETVLKTLKEQDVIKNEIAFILFDYHFDAPFEPAVGLCQTHERDSLTHEFGPLCVYGSAEMEYFSENLNPAFNFTSNPRSKRILNETSRLIQYNHEYEEQKQLIIDTYIDICKELMANEAIKEYIKIANDFHIVANDFSEINVEVYLKALLPTKQYDALNIK